MPKVTIIYRNIPQYRIEFYNLLREGLQKKGIEFDLIYGDNPFKGREDSVDCEWATFKKNYTLSLLNIYIIWQPCTKEIRNSDLVIVEQANKLLFNYYLILRKIFGNKKFAFWGHGLNMQLPKKSLFNRFKMTYINKASWWFAYTEGIKNFLVDQGVESNKITVVQNAIDTKTLNELYHSIPEEEVEALRKQHGIEKNERVLIYCGALSKEKNIQFLLDSADELKAKGHKFKLLVMGNGPLLKDVQKAAEKNPWIIYTGPKFGRDKALYFRISDIFLLPGAMGLAILDSFAFETPMVTIKYDHHGPEFEYIVDDYNAVIADNSIEDFTNRIGNLLNNPEKMDMLKKTSALMIQKYNIQSMVDNFIDGIEKALK
ncbi:MAG: glycosyltransferase family 4 protein [Bacteroidetes bacterium]|nr:glycosyltransferase family 4 protein [Bacteroidota bacterium]